jgi:hypothetical protein
MAAHLPFGAPFAFWRPHLPLWHPICLYGTQFAFWRPIYLLAPTFASLAPHLSDDTPFFCQLFHWPAQFIECHTPFIFANYPIGWRNLLNATINYSIRPAQFIIECRATANIPFGWRSLLNATCNCRPWHSRP